MLFRFSLRADDARKRMFCRSIFVDTCNRRLFVCIVLLAGACSPPVAWGQRFAPAVAHPTSFRSPRLHSQSLQASLAGPERWSNLPFFRKPFHRHDRSSHNHRSHSKRSGCRLHSMRFLRPLQISISARRVMARPISSRKRTFLPFARCSPTSRRSFRPRPRPRPHLLPRHLRRHRGRYPRRCRHTRSLICPLYHPSRLYLL